MVLRIVTNKYLSIIENVLVNNGVISSKLQNNRKNRTMEKILLYLEVIIGRRKWERTRNKI